METTECNHVVNRPYPWNVDGEIACECVKCGMVGVYRFGESSAHRMISPPTTITKREEILQKAIQCVTVDRQATHGKPENSFQDIAHLWSWYLDIKIEPWQVAVMMSLFKHARHKSNPSHEDNACDSAGYMAIATELLSSK